MCIHSQGIEKRALVIPVTVIPLLANHDLTPMLHLRYYLFQQFKRIAIAGLGHTWGNSGVENALAYSSSRGTGDGQKIGGEGSVSRDEQIEGMYGWKAVYEAGSQWLIKCSLS